MATVPADLLPRREYYPSPAVARCLRSEKTFRLLIGPRGEGKTVGSLMTIYTYALALPRQRWPIIVACVRDTRTNIGITTVPSIKEWWPEGIASTWTGKEFAPEVGEILADDGTALIRFHFFGCDSVADMNRFQSFECDVLYIEEPAPAAGVSGGISGDVVGVAVTSQRRESLALVVIATNPPDGEHWVAQIWGLPGAEEADWDLERRQAVEWIRERSCVVHLKPGDNTALTKRQPEYRTRNREVLTAFGRGDLVHRLVEGEVGNVQEGAAVVPEFLPQHVVDSCPQVPVGATLLMSWDPRQNPSAVLWYVKPGLRAWILASWQMMNKGVRELITSEILPWFALYIPHTEFGIQHTGDPNTTTPDQSQSAVSAARVIAQLIPGSREWVPGPVSIDDRRVPLHDAFNKFVQGVPWIQIDRQHNKKLIRALESGWHYAKDPSGRIIKQNWVKNSDADIGEACAYGCALLQRRQETQSTINRWRTHLSQQARDRQRGGGVTSVTRC